MKQYSLQDQYEQKPQQMSQAQQQQQQIQFDQSGTPMKFDPATGKWRKAKLRSGV
jgi:hypothetical protein